MIRVKDLNKQFGDNHVLKNINLDFANGRVYGIVGENGAGKTTTFRAIMGYHKVSSGEIRSGGDSLEGWPTHRIAAKGVGYTPEGSLAGVRTIAIWT